MAYTEQNFKTKKELKAAVKEGREVRIQPEWFSGCPPEGRVVVEGPHYPEPHRFYAVVEVVGGIVKRVVG